MGVLRASRVSGTMKILLCSFLLFATLGLSSGFLKKLWKKEEECDIVWEEHYQPHCTTSYEKHCEHKYLDKCHTEYTTECKESHERQCKTEYDTQCKTEYAKQCSNEYHEKCETEYIEQCSTEYTEECWDEHQDVCHTHPECHTTYVDHCEPVYKKQCYGGGKKKGKKYKRDVAAELVQSEEDDEDIEDIKKMTTSELLDIIGEAEENEISCSKRARRRNARLFIMVNIARRFLLKTATMLKSVRRRFVASARKSPIRNAGKNLMRNVGKYLMKPAWMFPGRNAQRNLRSIVLNTQRNIARM